MKRLFGASLTIVIVAAIVLPAQAADLPQVKTINGNEVPACATPGRLMAYLHSRNPKVDARFDSVATEYMRHGEELGIRWDIAFFQMVLETGALGFTGDVRSTQNNFAGLGASGGGAHGESFADVSSGVTAHLQHLLMYAGEHIDNPVADRTRKVQEWGVLTSWQKSIKGPMTFTLVAKQWAPTSRNYVRDLSTIASEFYTKACNGPDPQPELVQDARAGRTGKPATQQAAAAEQRDTAATVPDATTADADATAPPKVSGAEIARRAIEEERKENAPIKALGVAGMLGDVGNVPKPAAEQQAAAQPPAKATEPAPEVTILNPSTPKAKAKAETPKAKAGTETAKLETPKPGTAKIAEKGAEIQTASVAGAATQLKTPAASKAGKCKVWTASYGGQRAIIIKAVTDSTTNYTVLDVNDPTENREVDAYISAYAKGGEKVGAFASQTKALDKAFELCPEG
jgi:hypothetical protein